MMAHVRFDESWQNCPGLPAIANSYRSCVGMANSVSDLSNFGCPGKGDQRIELNTTAKTADLLTSKSNGESRKVLAIPTPLDGFENASGRNNKVIEEGKSIGEKLEAGHIHEAAGIPLRKQRIKEGGSIVKIILVVLGKGKQSQFTAGFGTSGFPGVSKGLIELRTKGRASHEDAAKSIMTRGQATSQPVEKSFGRIAAELHDETGRNVG